MQLYAIYMYEIVGVIFLSDNMGHHWNDELFAIGGVSKCIRSCFLQQYITGIAIVCGFVLVVMLLMQDSYSALRVDMVLCQSKFINVLSSRVDPFVMSPCAVLRLGGELQ